VLVAADGPVDAAGEPAFEIPATLTAESGAQERTDIRLLDARTAAAERVADDSWKDYLPDVTGVVSPQILTPSGLFAPSRNWSAAIVFSVPLFDGFQRRGLSRERQALLTSIRAEQVNVVRQARAEIRAALEAVRSHERALKAARAAAAQADEVLGITDIAFRAGATTNIEVIDAQRRARDAETTAAIAEDSLRRARLELLVALGRFPQ
jgi:outer membrane protein